MFTETGITPGTSGTTSKEMNMLLYYDEARKMPSEKWTNADKLEKLAALQRMIGNK